MPDLRAVILSAAQDFVRRQVPYVWSGASSSGVDCSGLVVLCYGSAGIEVGRTTWDIFEQGTEVPAGLALPGDLVFYDIAQRNDHVGIVSGDGMMIDAPSEGLMVRQEPIWQSVAHRFWRHPALGGGSEPPPNAGALVSEGLARVAPDDGLNVRAAPTLGGGLVLALPRGSRVFVGRRTAQADGHVWREVAFQGRVQLLVGWLAEEYLEAV